MVIAQFEKLVFGLSANTALLLNNIKLSAECETDSQSDNSQQYVTAKNGKPLQVTFTAIIDANLGSDVKESVVYALDGAQRGLQGYFYIAGEKVFPHNLRHLFARCFYRASHDISALANMLGHSSIETTRIYLVSTEDVYAKKIARLGLVQQTK